MSVPGYHRRDGARLANPTLMDYKVSTMLDAPCDIRSIIERVLRAMLGK